jgi:hypothetical protein
VPYDRGGRDKPGAMAALFAEVVAADKARLIIEYSFPRLIIRLWRILAADLSIATIQISIPS